MYSKGEKYKIRLKEQGIFYTAILLEEDEHSIKILDKNQEEIILAKSEIKTAKQVNEMTGEGYERKD